MKKIILAFVLCIQVLSVSGCVYSNNYDSNGQGQEMNEEQGKDAIDEIKESVSSQVDTAISENTDISE